MKTLLLPLLRLVYFVSSKLNGSRHGLDQELPRPLYVLRSYLPLYIMTYLCILPPIGACNS